MNSFNLSLFGGSVECNAIVLFVQALVLLHALFHYYYFSYRHGYKFDVWTFFNVFFLVFCILPYPVAASDQNAISVGAKMWEIGPQVDRAFLLNVLGYAFSICGFHLRDFLERRRRVGDAAIPSAPILARAITKMLSRPLGIFLITAPFLAIAVGLMGVAAVRYGGILNLRARFMADPGLRPVYNLCFTTGMPLLMTWWLLAYFDRGKDKKCGFMFGLLFFLTFAAGIRSALVAPFLALMPLYCIRLRKRCSLVVLAACAVGLIAAALLFAQLRSLTADSASFGDRRSLLEDLLYGNSFSDIRDFAWVLSGWDGKLWMGMTYLSGLLGFLPRVFVPFREEWGMGIMTARVAGLDPELHPGLRVGMFGESYFNFGVFGVVVFALCVGYIWRGYDVRAKSESAAGAGFGRMYQWVGPSIIITGLQATSSAFRIYVFLGMVGVGACVAMMYKPRAKMAIGLRIPRPGPGVIRAHKNRVALPLGKHRKIS